jgi:hypothetical protein
MTPDWQKTAKLLTEGKDITWEAYLEQIARDNAPIGQFASTEEVAISSFSSARRARVTALA